MLPSERIQKLFSSPVFLFVFFGLLSGTWSQLFADGPFSWKRAILFGIPGGLIMTIAVLRRVDRLKEVTGLSDPTDLGKLQKAYKTGELPTDPKLRKGMRGYLEDQLNIQEKAIRFNVPLMYVMAALVLVLSFYHHAPVLATFAVGFALLARFSRSSTQRTIDKIKHLHNQLDAKHPAPAVPAAEPKRSSMLRKVTIGILVVIVLFVIFFVIGVIVQSKESATPASDSQPTGEPSPAGLDGPSIPLEGEIDPNTMHIQGNQQFDETIYERDHPYSGEALQISESNN